MVVQEDGSIQVQCAAGGQRWDRLVEVPWDADSAVAGPAVLSHDPYRFAYLNMKLIP
jgi:hypothetical protein